MTLLIVEALERFGGEAHRDIIIDYIVASQAGAADGTNLRDAVMACFDREAGELDRADVVFGLRFGPGSHRWTLGPAARQLHADG
jgi:hypothetical protein